MTVAVRILAAEHSSSVQNSHPSFGTCPLDRNHPDRNHPDRNPAVHKTIGCCSHNHWNTRDRPMGTELVPNEWSSIQLQLRKQSIQFATCGTTSIDTPEREGADTNRSRAVARFVPIGINAKHWTRLADCNGCVRREVSIESPSGSRHGVPSYTCRHLGDVVEAMTTPNKVSPHRSVLLLDHPQE